MSCVPCKKPNLSKDPLVDMEKILCDYAWNELADATWWDKRCKNKLYKLEVNWNYLDPSHRVLMFKTRKEEQDKDKKEDHNKEDNAQKKKEKTMKELKSNVAQRDLVMFRTEFSNTSPTPQKFTFKTERSTKSSASISVQRGWRIGGNLNLNLAVPVPGASVVASKDIDPCSITGGLSGSLEVTKTKGQTYEETLTWSVDSEISVEKNTRTVATLLVREEQFTADFTLETTFKCLRDVIPVYLFRKKDDKMQQILEIPSDTFADIFEGLDNFYQDDNHNDNVIKCRSRGTFKAVYGAEQLIKVESYPLTKSSDGVGEGTSSQGALAGMSRQSSEGPVITEIDDGHNQP